MDEKSLLPLPARKSNYKPILLVMLCSFLLGGGSCFGFASTLTSNGNSPMSSIFAASFLLCALVFLGSIVGIVVKAVRASSGGRS